MNGIAYQHGMSNMPVFTNDDPPRLATGAARPALALAGLDAALDLLHPFFRNQPQEHLRALYLDQRDTFCGMGAWTGERHLVDIPVRRILSSALAADAKAMILAHNHPSGDPNPSVQDVRTTRNLARICAAIDIKLLDHIIISDEKVTSMRALRLI